MLSVIVRKGRVLFCCDRCPYYEDCVAAQTGPHPCQECNRCPHRGNEQECSGAREVGVHLEIKDGG